MPRTSMLRGLALGLLASLFVLAPTAGRAMTLRVAELRSPDPDFCLARQGAVPLIVLVEGDFTEGDARLFARAIERIAQAGDAAYVCGLYLDSNGGNIYEAMAMGRFIRANALPTRVMPEAVCLSACVFVLVGGVVREVDGLVGIHTFYAPELLGSGQYSELDAVYSQASQDVAVYLLDMHISQQLLDRMFRIQHYDLEILSRRELRDYGIVGIDPVYEQSRPQ